MNEIDKAITKAVSIGFTPGQEPFGPDGFRASLTESGFAIVPVAIIAALKSILEAEKVRADQIKADGSASVAVENAFWDAIDAAHALLAAAKED